MGCEGKGFSMCCWVNWLSGVSKKEEFGKTEAPKNACKRKEENKRAK